MSTTIEELEMKVMVSSNFKEETNLIKSYLQEVESSATQTSSNMVEQFSTVNNAINKITLDTEIDIGDELNETIDALNIISDWMGGNQPLIEGMTIVVEGFFLAWKGVEIVNQLGGLDKIVQSFSGMLGPFGIIVGLFGTLVTIAVFDWLSSVKGATDGLSESQRALKNSTDEIVNGLDGVETDFDKFSTTTLPEIEKSYMDVSQTLSENRLFPDIGNTEELAEKTKTMYDNVIGAVEEKTSLIYETMAGYYAESDGLITEEEQKKLDALLLTNEETKKNAEIHYNDMMALQNTALAEGREMNETELDEFQRHNDELNKIGKEAATFDADYRLEALKNVNVERLLIDEDYRKQYAENHEKYRKEREKEIADESAKKLGALELMNQLGIEIEGGYADARQAIIDESIKEIDAMREEAMLVAMEKITGANAETIAEYARLDREILELESQLNNSMSGFIDEDLRVKRDALIEERDGLGIKRKNWEGYQSWLNTLPMEFRATYENINAEFSLQPGVDNINSQKSNAYNAGVNVMTGLEEGIGAKVGSAISKMGEVGTGMINAFKRATAINSPSRAFKELGVFIDEGLQLGVIDGTKDVINSVKSMATQMLSAGKVDLSKSFVGYGDMQTNIPSYSTSMEIKSNINDVENKMATLEDILTAQLNVESEKEFTFNLNTTLDMDGDTLVRKQSKIQKRRLMAAGGIEL